MIIVDWRGVGKSLCRFTLDNVLHPELLAVTEHLLLRHDYEYETIPLNTIAFFKIQIENYI